MFYLPRSLFNFISLLLPLHNFYHFPSSSTILLFSLLHLHLLIYSIYFSIHKYIDLLSTLHRPYIDPTSTLLSTFFNIASWIVKLYTTNTTTFLLFSLHHLHCHHISIVFPPPGGGGGKTIGSRESGVDCLRQLWQVHTVLSDFLRKLLLQWN